jgi:hypothetical protein
MSDDCDKSPGEIGRCAMSDTLKQRLDDLNRQIQVQRNIEMHAAMERARLETQRVELMSQMLSSSVAPPATITPTSPYRVVMQMSTPDKVSQPLPGPSPHPADARRRQKPDGLPSVAAMITAVLKETPNLRPAEIADSIRKQWWPDLQTPTISTTAWRMVRSGHLTQQDGRYAISGTSHRQNGSGHDVSVVST